MTDVVVVGGGITGLVASRELSMAGASVTLLDPGRLGGKLQTTAFAGGTLDEAADAFLARVPEAIDLCRELGLGDDLVEPAARRAHVWSRGALRLLPSAQVLGVPTDVDEVAASGIVSPEGIAALQGDLSRPLVAPTGDTSIGAFFRDRLGHEVTERLIDPLVGGINAGDTDHLSLQATVPQLDAAARSGAASIIDACRAQRAAVADPDAPVFHARRGGMGALAEALVTDLGERGVTIRATAATRLVVDGPRWRVALADGPELTADAVVLCAPAGVSSTLLRPIATRAATLLGAVPYASVALVAIAAPRASIDRELDGSGYLVPRVEGRTITACSFTSAKWAHLGLDGTTWLRASVGRDGDDSAVRLDDDALTTAVLADLADTMALHGPVDEVRISRWIDSFPQYRPGHLDRVAAIEADLAALSPAVVVAGAALRGLGVPACIRQARAAAVDVLARLG